MINCNVSVCDIYLRCTNLFVHFVAIYIFHCVLSQTTGRHHFVGLILNLYFDEDQRSFMIVIEFWKNIGSLFFYR